jgi:hypothetical protein
MPHDAWVMARVGTVTGLLRDCYETLCSEPVHRVAISGSSTIYRYTNPSLLDEQIGLISTVDD